MDINLGDTKREWIGYAIAASLLWGVAAILWARQERTRDRYSEIIVDASSDKTTIEKIVSAQHGMMKFREVIHSTNIAILKIRSILLSKASKVVLFSWLYCGSAYSSVLPILFLFF